MKYKYIDADQLKAEIERLESENNCGTFDFIEAKRIAYNRVKRILDSLPEQPASESSEKIGQLNVLPKSARHSEGLEEAARKYGFEEYRRRCEGGDYGTSEDAFKAGAEWQANQGASYETVISADKTVPVLPMKDVSEMGFDYGDKVVVQIKKK